MGTKNEFQWTMKSRCFVKIFPVDEILEVLHDIIFYIISCWKGKVLHGFRKIRSNSKIASGFYAKYVPEGKKFSWHEILSVSACDLKSTK